MSKRRTVTVSLVIAAVLFLVGYALFGARMLIVGPEIIVMSPESGTSFSDPLIELHGKALRTSFITLNGQPLFVDQEDVFRVPLVLAPGTSIMKLNARDRFNRETELTLWYTYTGEVHDAATAPLPTQPMGTSSSATSSVLGTTTSSEATTSSSAE
ncbi:MAG: hypothetical protein RL150_74 [Candidatus Parcubacteria bacterium]|jgi:hypothetical protein